MTNKRAAGPALLLGGLLAGAVGCGAGGIVSTAPVSGTLPAAGFGARALASAGGCAPWAGLNDLSSETTWLRQLIGDEVIFGAGTRQAQQDGQAVIAYAQSLAGFQATLAPKYVVTLRDDVLAVARSPFKETPEQLNTAANAAEELNAQLDAPC